MKEDPVSETKSILLLTTAKTEAVKKFVRKIEEANPKLRMTLAVYNDLDYYFLPSGISFKLHDSGKDVADFDLVHFKTTVRYLDIAAGIARYLDRRKVPFVSRAAVSFPSTSKFYQYVILSDNNVAIPNSLLVLPERLDQAYRKFADQLGVPFVLKDINGSKGNFNYLVNDQQDFSLAVSEARDNNIRLIGQKFINNSGDYRVLVLGQKISLVIFRSRTSNTHVNNTSQGAASKLVAKAELPDEVQANSLKAAQLLDREIAGVDMVKDDGSGLWYCFEVNDGPQIATGSFEDEKVKVFAEFLETHSKQ